MDRIIKNCMSNDPQRTLNERNFEIIFESIQNSPSDLLL